jgi:transitional endoplasmic reticulum ATPase
LQKKKFPNSLLADESVSDDSSVGVHPLKMKELNLVDGDSILVRGKKRKTTVAIVHSDPSVSEGKIAIGKVARSNIR